MKKTGEMIRANRKNRYPAFDGGRNLPQVLLLAGVFGMGLWLSGLAGGGGSLRIFCCGWSPIR